MLAKNPLFCNLLQKFFCLPIDISVMLSGDFEIGVSVDIIVTCIEKVCNSDIWEYIYFVPSVERDKRHFSFPPLKPRFEQTSCKYIIYAPIHAKYRTIRTCTYTCMCVFYHNVVLFSKTGHNSIESQVLACMHSFIPCSIKMSPNSDWRDS